MKKLLRIGDCKAGQLMRARASARPACDDALPVFHPLMPDLCSGHQPTIGAF
jgi:hypothetical protein